MITNIKCAHEACTCSVEMGERYCCAACRDDAAHGGTGETRDVCHCRHSSCEAR